MAELVVENDYVDSFTGNVLLDLFQFSFAHKGAAVGMGQLLYISFYGYGARGLGQEGEFVEVFPDLLFGLCFVD